MRSKVDFERRVGDVAAVWAVWPEKMSANAPTFSEKRQKTRNSILTLFIAFLLPNISEISDFQWKFCQFFQQNVQFLDIFKALLSKKSTLFEKFQKAPKFRRQRAGAFGILFRVTAGQKAPILRERATSGHTVFLWQIS